MGSTAGGRPHLSPPHNPPLPANDQLLHPLAASGRYGRDVVGRFALGEVELRENLAGAVNGVDRQYEAPGDWCQLIGHAFEVSLFEHTRPIVALVAPV